MDNNTENTAETTENAIVNEVSQAKTDVNTENTVETVEIKADEVSTVLSDNPQVNNTEIPVNEEALSEQKQKFIAMGEELKALILNSETNDDFRTLRKNFVELKEKVIALFLISKDEKDKILDEIQDAYKKISEKQDELKEKMDSVFSENLAQIAPKVDEVINNAISSTLFNEGRKMLIEFQNQLKEIKLRRVDRESIFKRVQETFEEINKKQDAEREGFEMESSENFLLIKPQLEEAIKFSQTSENFNEARQKLIDLQQSLKDKKLKKSKRDEIYSTIREAFNQLNDRQDKSRSELNEKSTEFFATIKPKLDEVIEFAKTSTDYVASKDKLIALQNEIKEATLLRSQRDELFSAIREVFPVVLEKLDADKEQFENECNENYTKLEIKVNEAVANVQYSDDFRDIREGLVAVQDEVKILRLKKDQRNELFKRIRQAFNDFDTKRNKWEEKRKSERSGKLDKLLVDLKQRIDRLKLYNTDDSASLDIQKAKLEHLADDNNSETIKATISELEAKIAERQTKIEGLEKRIADINSDLNKADKTENS